MKKKVFIGLTVLILSTSVGLITYFTLLKDITNREILDNKPIETVNNTENKIEQIVSTGPQQSSNPFDYVNANKEIYNELLTNPKETFEYAIKDLINSNASKGLTSYIEALLCSEINKNFKYDFETGKDYLEKYIDFLTKCDCIYNEYDNYAITLLK